MPSITERFANGGSATFITIIEVVHSTSGESALKSAPGLYLLGPPEAHF